MAVQIPDPGTGNNQTGDNEYVFRKKVKDNFSDQTNAASRLVGPAAGNVIEVGAFGLGAKESVPVYNFTSVRAAGLYSGGGYSAVNYPAGSNARNMSLVTSNRTPMNNIIAFGGDVAAMEVHSVNTVTNLVVSSAKVYTDKNTTKDANGFIKAASPIVKVFADKVELNGEAVDQDVTYKKNGIGDYTITTVSGLSTDGWYIELPKDMNGNPKVAVTLQETNGVISLKSYKRIFSMETFTFVPDLNEPLDIPDGRWIDLRLNEIPVELSEPELEV